MHLRKQRLRPFYRNNKLSLCPSWHLFHQKDPYFNLVSPGLVIRPEASILETGRSLIVEGLMDPVNEEFRHSIDIF